VSFSVYEITVPVMVHGLNVLDTYLDFAETLERKEGIETGMVLEARLAPDMLTFGQQVSVSCNKVEAHMAKLMQQDPPPQPTTAMTYPDLKARVRGTRTFLEAVEPDDLVAARTHTYELTPPIVMGWFGGDDYIRHLMIPDFFFHIAVAHAILRHLGAPIGKRDYLGYLSLQYGGFS
jgi:hypothetical protein